MDTKVTPFIHVFSQHGNYYLYDVNTDTILLVPLEVYQYLEQIEQDGIEIQTASTDVLNYTENLKSNGFLKTNRVVETKHPMTDVLEDCLNNKINHMILQVTQKCNLRCSYCIYSGDYTQRTHSQKQMSFDIAKDAIDYLINHSRDSKLVTLSFYGGEPIMNMSLIKECVEYADRRAEGRQIKYSMTTNGTLLNHEVVSYLVEHGFAITISLDGPQHIHDKNRLFSGSGKGSFAIMMDNVRNINEHFPEYYYSGNIMFNGVLDPSTNFRSTNDFVVENDIFKAIKYTVNGIDKRYTDKEVPYSDDFFIEKEYEFFKFFLKKLGRLKKTKVSQLLDVEYRQICYKRGGKHIRKQSQLPRESHRSGPCVPGYSRLFVNADGFLYPCERVSEISKIAEIGHIRNGIDIEKANKILNIERITASRCQ